MYLLQCLSVTTVLLITVNCDLRTEYYVNLINQGIAKAEAYERPLSNVEFKSGVDSIGVIDHGKYDFIIVGAGAAGSVLATRLSEIDHWKILLLEAGGEEDDFNTIPGMYPYLPSSERNWGYYTTPQTTCCLDMPEQKCDYPLGKSVGGSTAINGLAYSRSNAEDTNRWVELGNPGWSYEEVLPYYIKSENSQIDGDRGYHGKGGFWNVEYSLPQKEITSCLLEAGLELNLSNVDYNGAKQLGMSKIQTFIRRGRRLSTGTAFLDNARKREGTLTVVTRALVTKVNIEERTKVAKGVTFVKDGVKYSAVARKEVILSGGAINSPQLLMLSGIGPKCHLEELGIEVIRDLPVATNLLEHVAFPGIIFHTNLTAKAVDMESQIKLYLNGYGPLTSPTGTGVLGFVHNGDVSETVPLIEYIFVSSTGANSRTDISIAVFLLHVKSRGRVFLKSSDPIDFPNIDLNLLSEPEDVRNLIDGIQFILPIADTEAFRKINATLADIPSCTNFEKYSREFWECALRHMSAVGSHPQGTTPMGPNSTNSVVDTNLKVHGIKNLRVVDAGVIPSPVSSHTTAPTVMIAEKISDVIKRDYI